MTPLDLAWLAGLMEGEGSFTYAEKGLVSAQVKMTDLDVMQRVGSLLGVSPVAEKPASERHKIQYKVRVKGPKAVRLMKMLLPHMGVRRSLRIKELMQEL